MRKYCCEIVYSSERPLCCSVVVTGLLIFLFFFSISYDVL